MKKLFLLPILCLSLAICQEHIQITTGEVCSDYGYQEMTYEECEAYARKIGAPTELVEETAKMGRLPVVNFAAGGIATPADAALMMHHGCDGIFVGSGIFGAEDPVKMANAIVEAVNNWDNKEKLVQIHILRFCAHTEMINRKLR